MNKLFAKFPKLISKMKYPGFTSHEFILELFKQNQREFIEALYLYRNSPAPMREVTRQLSNKLHDFKSLVAFDRRISSPNIFGKPSRCATWIKK